MLLLPLWIVFACLALINADSSSESDESGESHPKHHRHSKSHPRYSLQEPSNLHPYGGFAPYPSGFIAHQYNHPAYNPSVQPVMGWYQQPAVGYGFPRYSDQAYYGPPQGPFGYVQSPPPYQVHPQFSGYGYPITYGGQPAATGFSQQPPVLGAPQPAFGENSPPQPQPQQQQQPPSSSSSSSSSSSTSASLLAAMGQQQPPVNPESTGQQPTPVVVFGGLPNTNKKMCNSLWCNT